MTTSKEVGNGHGYLCPKCNEGTDLHIQVSRFVELWPDGTGDDDGNSEWDDTTPAKCDCGWEGTVGDFHTVELED